MAIDRMKKAWLVSPAADAASIPDQLARMGLLHVSEVAAPASPGPGEAGEAGDTAISRLPSDTREAEGTIRRLTEIVDVLSEFSKLPGDFLSSLIPTPIETTRDALADALGSVDVPALHEQVKGLASRRAAAKAAGEQAAERLAAVGAFAGHKVALPAEGSLRWTHAALWLLPARQAARIFELGLGPEPATLEQLGTLDGKTLVASVCLKEHRESVAAGLRGLGLEAIPSPAESTTLDAYVEALEAERRRSEAEFDACSAELAELGKLRVKVELVLGHWEERRETSLALAKMAATGRAAVLVGYVRERELADFQAAVSRQLPQVSMVMEDPCAEDDVPVSLTCSRLVRPASFLVEMFGLPSYFQFDPSAFLMVSFVLFFGICLGDAIYGIVLFAMSWALIKRYRDYPGIRSLFELLAYGAVASFVVGVLTATWAADLFTNYVGQGNLLGRIVGGLRATDPLQKPLVALGIALFLGIANQFWGIGMRMYKCWRTGDKAGALFDGGFWLILLPGVVLLVAAFFAPGLPGWVSGVGAALAVTGAIGLVLTQGRKEETLVGKIVVGVVSLYGIVGSYGTVAFIGDTLSYSRLLALGLTTAIVGTAVNIIAGMLNVDIAVVGVLLFIIVAVLGHFFNLLISGLGAFIHSARLIFVEFFGRFYEPGAQRFSPLGATGGRIRVVDR